MKKLLAMMLTLAMLITSIGTVSFALETDPYEYFPRDITLVSYENNNTGFVLAWKNPTSEALDKVTVTDASDNVQIGVVDDPIPGMISRVVQSEETYSQNYGNRTVKMLFEFTDGEKREIYYTNDKRNYNLVTTHTAGKISISNLNDWNIFTTNSQNTTAGGNNALMVISNINTETSFNNNRAQIFFNRLATGGGGSFTKAGSLKDSTRYNFEYKIKASSADTVVLSNYVNSAGAATFHNGSNAVTVTGDGDWQTVSGAFTTPANISSNGYVFFAIGFKQATNEPFYIDDVKLTELTGDDESGYTEYTGENTSSYTFDMEDVTGAPAKPTITASAGDASATFGWTKEAGFINIYEVIDGARVLRARMDRNGSTASVDIPYLTNNKLYTFEVTAMTSKGLESEAEVVEVTPMAAIPDVAPEKYTYEPGNLMVVGNAGGNYSGISWINPTSDKLISVKAYLINADGTETDLTAAMTAPATGTTVNTPSAVVRLSNETAAVSGNASYRLVFTFSDGEVRNIIYTGTYQAKGGVQLVQPSHDTVNAKGIDIYENGKRDSNIAPDSLATLSNTEYKSGTTSLKLTSNATDSESGNYELINFKTSLAQADYNVKMWVKTIETTEFNVANQKKIIPNTGGEWRQISLGTINFNGTLGLETKCGGFREIYIDDITFTATDATEPAITISFDFGLSVPADFSGVAAEPEDGGAIVTWTPDNSGFASVYEKLSDGTLVLRARVRAANGDVELKNLTNDKKYTFVVKHESASRNYGLGLQSAGTEIEVTPAIPEPTKYDYEPGNVSITDWRSGFAMYGHKLSWINPVSEKLNGVEIYKINSDGSETAVTPGENDMIFMEGASTAKVAITTPGAIVHINDQSTDEAFKTGKAKYRLVFRFSDGQVRNIIYSNDWKEHKGEQLVNTTGKVISVYAGYEFGIPATNTSHTQSSAAEIKMSSKTAPTDDVLSMEITSNQTTNTTGRYFVISAVFENTNAHTVSMKINTQEATVVQIGGSDILLPDTEGEWQDFSASFTPHNTTQFQIKTREAAREIYIGGTITVKDASDNVKFTYDIDTDAAYSSRPEVSGAVIAADNGMTTISWNEATGQYVNVYEQIDLGSLMLRARVPVGDKSVTLNNLTNDVEHKFVVKAEYGGNTWLGLEGAGVELSATPTAPDYEVNDLVLQSLTGEIDKLSDGEFFVEASVTNNKLNAFKAQVVVAVYDGDVLEKCFVSEAPSVEKGKTEMLVVDGITLTDSANKNYTAKVMLWKGIESATPLWASKLYSE